MSISIVTPVYNGERFLSETIESVRAQTFSDWEYLLVDDGSSDSSFAIAQRYEQFDPRIRAVSKQNGGVASARNYGYERTSPESEHVIFLDQDDLWTPQLIARLHAALSENREAVGAHCLCVNIDSDGRQIGEGEGIILCRERRKMAGMRIVESAPAEPTTFATMVCDCAFPTTGAMLIRRSALRRLCTLEGQDRNGSIFDTAMLQSDDWDLWLRLCLLGDIAFVAEPLLRYRKHDSNVSNVEERMLRAGFMVRGKLNANPHLNAEQRKMAHWRYRRVYASFARRNMATCGRWFAESVRAGDLADAAFLIAAWWRLYTRYLRVRGDGNLAERGLPVPERLTSREQLLRGRV